MGATSTSRAARHQPVGADAFPRDHEWCARLDQAERAVLTDVAALVLPVVRGRVQNTEIGSGRGIEELGDVLERERVRVVAAMRMRPALLLGERRERAGRLVGERVVALDGYPLETVRGAAKRDPAVVGARLVHAVSMPADHVDDGIERTVAQDGEGSFGGGPRGVGDLVGCDDIGHSDMAPSLRHPWLRCVRTVRNLDRSSRTGYPVSFVRRCLRAPGRPAIERVQVRTFTPKAKDITRQWHVIDADGAILGRLSTEVATLLRGKHKPIWAPHVDTGDHVVIVNAAKLAIGQRKQMQKTYFRHTGYPGGIRSESLEHLMARNPERVVRLAIRRMLPKGPLGRQMLKKLKVYAGPTHPHQAQQPVVRPLPERAKARTT